MQLFCSNCQTSEDVYVELSGPHLKATCTVCQKYIKFLSVEEKKELENEEDKLHYSHVRR